MKILLLAYLLAHSWYPHECCSDKDCHPIACSEIRIVGDKFVYTVDGKTFYMKVGVQRHSQDESCHVCHMDPKMVSSGSDPVEGYCIFMPDGTT